MWRASQVAAENVAALGRDGLRKREQVDQNPGYDPSAHSRPPKDAVQPGRRICTEDDQHLYHVVAMPPKQEGVCDRCRVDLELRTDDKPETVEARLVGERRAPDIGAVGVEGDVHDLREVVGGR